MLQIRNTERERKKISRTKGQYTWREEIGKEDVGKGEAVISQMVNNELIYLLIVANTYKATTL